MILAVYKSSQILKDNSGMTTIELIRIIIRDQLTYFSVWVTRHKYLRSLIITYEPIFRLIFVSVAAILNYFFTPPTIPGLIITESIGNPSILSSVGARLLLNMKEAGAKGLNEGMISGALIDTVSGMDFAAPPTQVSKTSSFEGAEGRGSGGDMDTVDVWKNHIVLDASSSSLHSLFVGGTDTMWNMIALWDRSYLLASIFTPANINVQAATE